MSGANSEPAAEAPHKIAASVPTPAAEAPIAQPTPVKPTEKRPWWMWAAGGVLAVLALI